MASTFSPFHASPILCSASSDGRKSDPSRRKTTPSSPNWWTPIFGWSSDPDYILNSATQTPNKDLAHEVPGPTKLDSGRPGSRFALGCFTEEKAKELRKKTIETSSFHDMMYHSGIASRLASDTTGRRDP